MSEKNSQIIDRLPPLNTMRVFEAAARHLSFVRAAQELFVTHGAVSRQIKQLEAVLGFDLFDRRNRAVFLTAKGEVLFEACVKAMDTLRQAIAKIKTPSDALPLVLSCEPTIAIRWLVPRLPDFRARFPAYQIHLLTAGGKIDFARDRVDVALRRNDFSPDADCYVQSVAPEMVGPVCSASLPLNQQGTNNHFVLGKQRLLHSKSRPNAWNLWREHSGFTIESQGNEQFEHFYLSLQAAGAGLGVAVGSIYMVEADIGDGRLVAPFGFIPDGSEYVLLSPVPFDSDPRRLVFLDWIRYEMGKTRHAAER
jgi:DNA-binding transcriptional LysR family regulator